MQPDLQRAAEKSRGELTQAMLDRASGVRRDVRRGQTAVVATLVLGIACGAWMLKAARVGGFGQLSEWLLSLAAFAAILASIAAAINAAMQAGAASTADEALESLARLETLPYLVGQYVASLAPAKGVYAYMLAVTNMGTMPTGIRVPVFLELDDRVVNGVSTGLAVMEDVGQLAQYQKPDTVHSMFNSAMSRPQPIIVRPGETRILGLVFAADGLEAGDLDAHLRVTAGLGCFVRLRTAVTGGP